MSLFNQLAGNCSYKQQIGQQLGVDFAILVLLKNETTAFTGDIVILVTLAKMDPPSCFTNSRYSRA